MTRFGFGRTILARRGRVIAIAALAVAASSPVWLPAPAGAAAAGFVTDPASLVNPLIGTDGGANDFPGADVPFGMVQWSPDTKWRTPGGGYNYRSSAVTGFSLTHVSGPGCPVAGDIPVLPFSGPVPAQPATVSLPLDHSQETAQAGYYRLGADGITTDLTATTRSGMARFTFPRRLQGQLLLKLSNSAAGTDATSFHVVNSHEITGSVTSGHFCRSSLDYTVHFDMVFNAPFVRSGTWDGTGHVDTGATSLSVHGHHTVNGPSGAWSTIGVHRVAPHIHGAAAAPNSSAPATGPSGAYLTFRTRHHPVLMAKVGISYVSAADAARNRAVENPYWNFARVRDAAHEAWDRMLGRVQVAGGTSRDRELFYTALYHSLLHPNVFSDVNGLYEGFDGHVHRTPGGRVEYANISGWDIYRAQAQLEAVVAPRQASDTARSMLDQYRQTGRFPRWELDNDETYTMIGDPADAVLADYYAFGARDFAYRQALRAMIREASRQNWIRPGLRPYLQRGYLPYNRSYGCCNFYGAVSVQLEYNAADAAISHLAAALRDGTDAATFARRANNWQNIFDAATGFIEPKIGGGRFLPGVTPDSTKGFVEGDSYRYTAMVPNDVAGLIAAAGGRTQWTRRLDQLTSRLDHPGQKNADVGNEPSIGVPWEYDYTGAPWKTQRAVREIQQQIYTPEPAGLAGNDDLGTMSSWYVWSALGLYPETPGSADLVVGSPVFTRAVLHLKSGRTLTVVGHGAATAAPYVHGLTLDGKGYERAFVPGSLVRRGGTLSFQLTGRPDRRWATAPGDAPPSDGRGLPAAIGYLASPEPTTTPGTDVTLDLGVRALAGTPGQVSWSTATSSRQVDVQQASGTIRFPAHGDATQQVSVTAPSQPGRYTVTFQLRDSSGVALPDVVAQLRVTQPGDLAAYADNLGVAADGVSAAGDYDGDGWSYSGQQLAAAGWSPGATRSVGGLPYTFPNAAVGALDNVVAAGQTVQLGGVQGAHLGILGSATNAPHGAAGRFLVTYTDGSTATVTLGLADWSARYGTNLPYGNVVAATTSRQDGVTGGSRTVPTHLYAAQAAIDASKQVRSVTLPARASAGQLHLFAMAVG